MKLLTKKWAVGGVALGALIVTTGAQAAADVSAIDARLRALEAEIAKLRKEAKAAKAQAAAASSKATNIANAAVAKGDLNGAPPPVFVSLKSGLLVARTNLSRSRSAAACSWKAAAPRALPATAGRGTPVLARRASRSRAG